MARPVNDIGFIGDLIDYLGNNFCIDTGRVFASGHSNGGGLTNVLACDPVMSRRIAAFGAHSAAIYSTTSDSSATCAQPAPYNILTNTLVQPICSPGRPNVPWFEIHGDADGTIPYIGGGRRGYCLPAIPHTVMDWCVPYAAEDTSLDTPLTSFFVGRSD